MATIVEMINPLTGLPEQVDKLDHTAQEIDDAVGRSLPGAAIDASIQAKPNPNLLDNWYFGNPVNQRGKTEYTAAGYTIDRWKALSSSMSVAVTDEGIVLKDTNGGGAPYIIFDQKIELQQSVALAGKQVTFSVLVKSITGSLCLQSGSNKLEIKAAGLHTFTVNSYVGNSDHLIRIYNLSANTEAVIIAAKVELGSQQTLAHQDTDGNWVLNEIPNYGEQLRKCQRYYWQPSNVFNAIYYESIYLVVGVAFPVEMRVNPTVTVTDQNGNEGYLGMVVSGATSSIKVVAHLPQKGYLGLLRITDGQDAVHQNQMYGFKLIANAEL